MRRIDISFPVSPASPEWPGDTPFSCGWTWDMAAGASVNVSSVTTSPHVGTHADAPLHVRPGTPGSDALPLEVFHGTAVVVDVSHHQGPTIEWETLDAQLPAGTQRLLLKTGRTIASGVFPDDWPALSPACAAELMQRGVKLIGVDCPSVDDRNSKTLDVHHALFDGGAYVLENLDLRDAADGTYELIAFPVKWMGLDAAPVRAVLLSAL